LRMRSERGFWVLMDEVYLEFAWSRRPPPAFALSERILSVGSMTKAYGLGGIRLGWILAPPEIRTRAEQITDYISSQVAAPSIAIALAGIRTLIRTNMSRRTSRLLCTSLMAALKSWFGMAAPWRPSICPATRH
ncbi:MAG: aminotransferase class I/II-fold pyridoxal phosphate-dependent enzyme, partial [Planctomycetota bacterium]